MHLAPLLRVILIKFHEDVWCQKTRIQAAIVQQSLHDPIRSRFATYWIVTER